MRIAIGASKGGVGKTTTAVMLGLLLSQDGPTVLVDGDRQRSATSWWRKAETDGWTWPGTYTLRAWAELSPSRHRADEPAHTVIDTGPGDSERFSEAMRSADVVIVPSGARPADVAQTGQTIREVESVIGGRNVIYGVLVSMVRLGTRAEHEIPAAIDAADLGRWDTVIPLREAIAYAFGTVPTWPGPFGPFTDLLAEIQKETTSA